MLTIVSTQRDFQRILRQIRPSNEINNIIVSTIFDRCWFKNYRLKIVEQQAATHNDFDEQTQLTTSYETLLVCSSRGPFTAAFTPRPDTLCGQQSGVRHSRKSYRFLPALRNCPAFPTATPPPPLYEYFGGKFDNNSRFAPLRLWNSVNVLCVERYLLLSR